MTDRETASRKRGPKLIGDGTLPPLYDAPQLRRLGDGRLEMLDRFGFIMRPQTTFLQNLRIYYSVETCRAYAGMLLDAHRILAKHRGGIGMSWVKLSDAYLDKLRTEFIHEREVNLKTFKTFMTVLYRYLVFAQDNFWVQNLVGTNVKGVKFRINVPPAGFHKHPVMQGKSVYALPTMPSHRDLRLVEAEGLKMIKRKSLKRRFRLIFIMLKTLALRRSEGLRLDVWMVPSKKRLATLRARAVSGKSSWLVPISIMRSKKGGERIAQFPLDLLDEIREFIDMDRADTMRPGISCEAVFVSRKTGDRFSPAAFTNEFKRAARRASAMHPLEFGTMDLKLVRPHHLRHRGVTDMMRGFMAEGMEPAKALLVTMNLVGLRSIEVALLYLHLAEAEEQELSDEYKEAAKKTNERASLDIQRLRRELKEAMA